MQKYMNINHTYIHTYTHAHTHTHTQIYIYVCVCVHTRVYTSLCIGWNNHNIFTNPIKFSFNKFAYVHHVIRLFFFLLYPHIILQASLILPGILLNRKIGSSIGIGRCYSSFTDQSIRLNMLLNFYRGYHASTYNYTHTHTHTHTHTYIYIYTHTHTHIYTYTHTSINLSISFSLSIYIYIYIYIHTHTHTHISKFIRMHLHVYIYFFFLYSYTYIQRSIHIYL